MSEIVILESLTASARKAAAFLKRDRFDVADVVGPVWKHHSKRCYECRRREAACPVALRWLTARTARKPLIETRDI